MCSFVLQNLAITEETENAEDEDGSIENYELHFSQQDSGDTHTSFSSGNTSYF